MSSIAPRSAPETKKLTVSAVVLTYKRPDMLAASLRLLRGVRGLLEIIVIDNDPESDGAPDDPGDVIYIRSTENAGAVGRNEGIRRASGDIVITLDDDVHGIDDEALNYVRACFEHDDRLAALCFKVVSPAGRVINWCHHSDPERFADTEFLTYEISEGAVALRAAALRTAGYYPTSFFISHEGLDLACRLMNGGFLVAYTNRVAVTHHVAAGGRRSWRRYYYDSRNQIWIAVRNFPLTVAVRYLAVGLASTCLYSLRDGFFRYWLRAVRDGVRGIRTEWTRRNVISRDVRRLMKTIDSNRPGFWHIVRKRLFSRRMEI